MNFEVVVLLNKDYCYYKDASLHTSHYTITHWGKKNSLLLEKQHYFKTVELL